MTLFQIGCLPETLCKRNRNISAVCWPLSAFAQMIGFPCQRKQESGNFERNLTTNILSPKAPSTLMATIVSFSLWFGCLCSTELCVWLITSFHLIVSENRLYKIKLPKYIQNNRGIRNTIMMLQKIFVKDPGK